MISVFQFDLLLSTKLVLDKAYTEKYGRAISSFKGLNNFNAKYRIHLSFGLAIRKRVKRTAIKRNRLIEHFLETLIKPYPKRRSVKVCHPSNFDKLLFWTELAFSPVHFTVVFLLPCYSKKIPLKIGTR